MSGTARIAGRAEAGGDAARTARLDQALAAISAGATGLDREPRFPREAFAELAATGALAATIGAARAGASVTPEWSLLRRVAAADASVGRILDGHLNAVERLEVAAPPDLRDRELAAVAAGERLLGVWGADPGPGEGEPARLHPASGDEAPGDGDHVASIGDGDRGRPAAMVRGDGDGPVPGATGFVLRGVKTFCSGAGGVDAALVMVGRDDGVAPALVLVECDERVEVDRGWYRAAGLRSSESHRVIFHDAPAIVLGGPGELARDPWFSRDAMRTAASWAGMVDAAVAAALDDLAARRAEEPLAQLAAGRIEAARGTVDAWVERAARVADASVTSAAGAPGLADDGEPTAIEDDEPLAGERPAGPRGVSAASFDGASPVPRDVSGRPAGGAPARRGSPVPGHGRSTPGGSVSARGGVSGVRAASIAMRAEIDRVAKAVLGEAAAACGSYPFVTAGPLDRARRDLETFLLQHRLDPLLVRLGAERLRRR